MTISACFLALSSSPNILSLFDLLRPLFPRLAGETTSAGVALTPREFLTPFVGRMPSLLEGAIGERGRTELTLKDTDSA